MNFLFVLLSMMATPSHAQTVHEVDPRNPVPWTDVVYKGFYYLTIDLPMNEHIQLPQGTKFSFVEVMGGGGYVPVTFFELTVDNCPDPKATVDLFLINPTGGKGEDVGVEFRKNCHVVFYVENRLVGRPSFFTDSTE
ncbi:hypothetical protein [Bdellovibrio svalbardensis]|uniref:Uncharacterized protein n=1 Tax=Bdellovibrio svalbardensis TaxID=2972972 RepID=A0ABT6DPB6_9BACT|nr:hypothetical protein [Bdellovibrio svalbardensis]MDG0817925.1 hypothetical protein [Bdellovibrio svalbardensis]